MLYIFGIIIILAFFIYYASNQWDWRYPTTTWKEKHPIRAFLGKVFYRDWITWWSMTCIIVFSVFFAIVGICGIYEEVAKDTIKQEYLAEYEILQYQIDNDLSENYVSNDLTRTTYKDAIDYNQTVIKGRAYHNSFWYGCYYSDIYEDLPLIELPGGKE